MHTLCYHPVMRRNILFVFANSCFGAIKMVMTTTFHRKRILTQKLFLVMPIKVFDRTNLHKRTMEHIL